MKEALAKYNMAANIAAQRPAWETSGILREELSTVVSNRSATLLELGDFLGALVDAETVISIKRQWPKGHFRKARALIELGQIEEAKEAISLGLQFEPNNTVRHVHTMLFQGYLTFPLRSSADICLSWTSS
jgi:translocation protein SEC72